MASEEMRKKWGTIFMGEREASVEQLNAMQEHVNRDRIRKEQSEDYMERVRARATDRAREILGEAYTERQKVLEEAKGEAATAKRLAAQECNKIKAQGEEIRRQAEAELEAAQAAREEAERLKAAAHEEGYQDGMNQAATELHEFRAELGQSLAALMRAIERERRSILDNWRKDLVELTQAAVQAGTGLVLREEHEDVLRNLVTQALDLLENRNMISLRVNPKDEETVSDMFRAARERVPELKQWTVHGDDSVEEGGLLADSGSGSVDLRRENFREMVDGILNFLALPEIEREATAEQQVASLVEQEVAHIASLTPELDQPEQQPAESEVTAEEMQPKIAEAADVAESAVGTQETETAPRLDRQAAAQAVMPQPAPQGAPVAPSATSVTEGEETSLAELEEELFPLDEEAEHEADAQVESEPGLAPVAQPAAASVASEEAAVTPAPALDAKILNEGGFL